jgi:KaiC/GvpD/RAD55 family RecA-like ATPase
MYRKEVNEHSPIRILEQSIHGGLGKGNLGVVMARAGVGKTACLVQIGLDDLMRERPVLHVSLEHTVEHVQSWYDALFDDLAVQNDLDNEDEVRAMVTKLRVITSFADHDLWPERLEKTVEMFKQHLDFSPAAILVDGYDWSAHTTAENAAMIGAFKSYAKLLDAELWMTAQTHRRGTGEHPTKIPPPCNECESLIDVAIFLEPHGEDVAVRLLKDHDNDSAPDMHLHLHADTLRLFADEDVRNVPVMPTGAFTLLSGGAGGAEDYFGQCAEEWGLMELNFTFEGRTPKRTRGLVRLTKEELEQGAVSAIYIEAHMHRKYPENEIFRKTLQSIWHHVSTAREVFAVGWILDDKTVKGGTGWAVELARVWHKPIFVYDQAKKDWFYWDDRDWVVCPEAPKITARRFAGTGTRDLDEAGRTAIRDLYTRSFGAATE